MCLSPFSRLQLPVVEKSQGTEAPTGYGSTYCVCPGDWWYESHQSREQVGAELALRDSASLMTLIHVRIVEFRVMLLLYLEQHLNTYKTSSSGPPSSDEVQAHRPSMLTCPLLSAFRLLPRLFPLPGAHFYTNTQSFGHFSKPYGLSLTILSS